MKRTFMVFWMLIGAILLGQLAFAQSPRTLSYQGILTDSLGAVKPDGDYTVTFRLWDTATEGSWLWKEAKTLPVKKGLFSTQLGDETPFPPAVKFDRPYWLSVQLPPDPEMAPRLALSAVAYSMNALSTDSARIAGTVPNNSITTGKIADGAVTGAKIADGTIQRADMAAGLTVSRADTATFAQLAGSVVDNAVTSPKILNGTIQFADLGQNGATDGQVIKWAGGAWTAAADATGGGGETASGWTDNGTTIGLTTSTDTVSINSTSHMGKLNIGGNIGLNSNSKVYFGTAASSLGALGGNMNATAEGFTFAREGASSWMRVDNATKEVGIGTVAMADRLHVMNDDTAPCWMRVESAHPTQWGQAGLRIKTPQNMWNLRMDLHTNVNLPNGALSLHSQDTNREVMTWLEDGKVGVGTKNPIRRLHVNGSVEVKDTLYASAINAETIVNGPGVVHGIVTANAGVPRDYWRPFDSLAIQVPGEGYVLVLYSGTARSDHTYGDDTGLSISIASSSGGGGVLAWGWWCMDRHIPTGVFYTPVALQGVIKVSSAGTKKYYIVGKTFNPTGVDHDAIEMTCGSISALFIPAVYGSVELASTMSEPPSHSRPSESAAPVAQQSLEDRVEALTSQLQALSGVATELEALKRELAARGK